MDYKITKRKNSKALRISVDDAGGVRVSAPTITPKWMIDIFVRKHSAWIKARIRDVKTDQTDSLLTIGDQITLFGQSFAIIHKPEIKRELIIGSNINLKDTLKLSARLKPLIKAYSKTYLEQRVSTLNQRYFNFTYRNIQIREQRTRWGSCSNQKNLSFNWRLAFAPVVVSDYVIIHELAHLRYPNHQNSFWRLVAEACPDYQEHRRWLRKEGVKLKLRKNPQ